MLKLLLGFLIAQGLSAHPDIPQVDFHEFETPEQAISYFTGLNIGSIHPASSTTYRQAQDIVDSIWAAARIQYPEIINNLKTPTAIVVETRLEQAQIWAGPYSTVANAIVIGSAVLSLKKEVLFGILSHELGHLIFKQPRYPRFGLISAYSSAKVPNPPFGSVPEEDSDLASKLYPLIVAATRIGFLGFEMPAPLTMGDSLIGDMITYLIKYRGASRYACSQAEAARPLRSHIRPYYNKLEEVFEWTAAQKEAVAKNISKFNQLFRECAPEIISLTDFLKEFRNQYPQRASLSLGDYHAEKLFNDNDSISTNLIQVIEYYQKMAQTWKQSPNALITRSYTIEDHADEVAVRLLKSLNIPVEPFADYFINNNGASQAQQLACRQKIAARTPPTQGFPWVLHHSPCYRGYRILTNK